MPSVLLILYITDGAVEITNKVDKLIEDYHKKRKGYTLTFSDLMSIDELRLLIQGNFEDKVLKKHKWAKDGFKEKNAKELEALIRDTFVFHDIYAVNFLLANKFVQDAFIRVNIPTGFSPLDLGGRFFECLDDRFKSIGRGLYEEWNKNAENPKRVITDTATSMYFFDEIDSLDEKKLVYFLGQEFYKDYKKVNIEKNKIYTVNIEDMSDEGLGIGHIDGMAVFVKDTAPGDEAEVRIVKVKKNLCFGRLERIILAMRRSLR